MTVWLSLTVTKSHQTILSECVVGVAGTSKSQRANTLAACNVCRGHSARGPLAARGPRLAPADMSAPLV